MSDRNEAIPLEGECDPRFEAVREVFAKQLARQEVGAAISFTLDGETVVDLWGGWVDKAHTRPWARDTIVNTYSTTKGMTALVAHRLVEQGRIDLDAPVAEYWPEFADAGKQDIPVRWLLCHRAGLPAIRETMPDDALYDWDACCAGLARSEPWWKPGEQHGYHPMTYGWLVGEVIRRASGGTTVGELFRRDVAGPLGADFHIGLPESEHGRVSDMIGSIAPPKESKTGSGKPALKLKGPMADFMRDMTDPTTMVGRAFNNPRQPAGAVNTKAWRSAELPAANGHGTARALARIYGALSRGGEIDGVRLLEPETIETARTEQVAGPDATLGQLPIRYGLGYMLRADSMPFTPHPESFGHPGAGGSIGLADPVAKVGFGFVMNRMGQGLVGGSTGYAVLGAFFDAI